MICTNNSSPDDNGLEPYYIGDFEDGWGEWTHNDITQPSITNWTVSNYNQPDPTCPINIVHKNPAPLGPACALALNQSEMGQAAAVAWFLFFLVFGITLLNWKFGEKKLNY